MQCLGVCKVKKGCVALDIFIQMIKNIGEVIKIYTENYLIYTFFADIYSDIYNKVIIGYSGMARVFQYEK